MREIKFRIWTGKEYIYKSTIFETPYCLVLTLNGEITDIAYDRLDDYTEEFIIEQYTGLKDKNGIEIYEGDIVINRNWNSLLLDKKYKVIFDEYSCAFMIEDEYCCNMLSIKQTLEVTGNIHEEENNE